MPFDVEQLHADDVVAALGEGLARHVDRLFVDLVAGKGRDHLVVEHDLEICPAHVGSVHVQVVDVQEEPAVVGRVGRLPVQPLKVEDGPTELPPAVDDHVLFGGHLRVVLEVAVVGQPLVVVCKGHRRQDQEQSGRHDAEHDASLQFALGAGHDTGSTVVARGAMGFVPRRQTIRASDNALAAIAGARAVVVLDQSKDREATQLLEQEALGTQVVTPITGGDQQVEEDQDAHEREHTDRQSGGPCHEVEGDATHLEVGQQHPPDDWAREECETQPTEQDPAAEPLLRAG